MQRLFAVGVLALCRVAIVAASLQGYEEGPNLLANPGCESRNVGGTSDNGNAPVEWMQSIPPANGTNTLNCHSYIGTNTWTDYAPRNGSYYFLSDNSFFAQGAYAVWVYQTQPIPPVGATRIRASGWFYRQFAAAHSNAALRLSILDGPSGNTLSTARLPETGWFTDVGTAYIEKVIEMDIPAGGTHAQLRIMHSNDHKDVSTYGGDLWDDMNLRVLTPLSTGSTGSTTSSTGSAGSEGSTESSSSTGSTTGGTATERTGAATGSTGSTETSTTMLALTTALAVTGSSRGASDPGGILTVPSDSNDLSMEMFVIVGAVVFVVLGVIVAAGVFYRRWSLASRSQGSADASLDMPDVASPYSAMPRGFTPNEDSQYSHIEFRSHADTDASASPVSLPEPVLEGTHYSNVPKTW